MQRQLKVIRRLLLKIYKRNHLPFTFGVEPLVADGSGGAKRIELLARAK